MLPTRQASHRRLPLPYRSPPLRTSVARPTPRTLSRTQTHLLTHTLSQALRHHRQQDLDNMSAFSTASPLWRSPSLHLDPCHAHNVTYETFRRPSLLPRALRPLDHTLSDHGLALLAPPRVHPDPALASHHRDHTWPPILSRCKKRSTSLPPRSFSTTAGNHPRFGTPC